MDREISHLARLLSDSPEVALQDAAVIIAGYADSEVRKAIAGRAGGRRIVDLSGYAALREPDGVKYDGICR